MKTLVVFYSRTGTTRKVAGAIQKEMQADLEEIIDLKDRRGALGFIIGCKDAAMKNCADIKPIAKNAADYDLVIIGTPVWASSMSCAARTYITQNKDKFKNVAFFCTTGSSSIPKTLKNMEELCGKTPLATLGLLTKEVAKAFPQDKIKDFVKSLAV